MRKKLVHKAALGAVIFCLGAGGIAAVMRIVDDDDPAADFSRVQDAIDASSSGDVVLVRCGTYRENISMKDGVSVKGDRPQCAILDGGGAGSVVTFLNVFGPTEFSGFTVRNGLSFHGGGIRLEGSSPIITRTFIVGNQAVRSVAGYYGYGGGVSAYNSYPIITSTLIVGNAAETTGGGIDMYFSFPILSSSTIVGNSVFEPGSGYAYGGGVYSLSSDPTMISNVIFDNVAEAGGGGLDFINSPTFTIEYNDIFNNSPQDTSGLPDPPGPGNISEDPLLLVPDSLYACPRSDSPLLESGPPGGSTDVADVRGRPRHLDGDFDATALLDIGACEGGDITRLSVDAGGMVSWDASVNPSAVYNLYRGVLSELRSSCQTSCIYTQDPMSVAGAQQQCALSVPQFTDPESPPPDEVYYYLVTGVDAVEGVLGFLEDGSLRNNASPCL